MRWEEKINEKTVCTYFNYGDGNFYFDNAHNAHKKVYQNKSWWDEIEENYQFNLLNQKAITALFILKDGVNWDDFEAKANEIIMPSHQVKKIRTIKGVWDY